MRASQPTRVFAVVNPVHRASGRAVAELRRRTPPGARLRVLTTTRADPGPGQAMQALAAGADAVVAVGGDGTVRLVAGVLAGTGVPLGIVPSGTANLFARNLGMRPRDLGGAADRALFGAPRALDIGWSRHRIGPDWSPEQPFLVLAGLGHDARAILATGHGTKSRLGWAAYLAVGVRLLGRRPVPVTVRADDGPERRVATWCVLAGNCGRLPGGVRVFADARPDDGLLDTLLVPLRHPGEWAGVAAKGVLRLRGDVAALEYGRATALTVRPDEPQPLHLDGDAVAGVAEARWRVAPGALLVN